MASINLVGVLRDPTGEFSYKNKIRFTHNTTTGQTLKGFSSVYAVEVDGAYDIDLEYGNVLIETFDVINMRWISNGVLTINSDTPATDLPSLLGITTPATNADLLVFQVLVADAEIAATESEAAQLAAEAAAQGYADITGGMIVRRADDNGNYNVMLKIPMFTLDAVNTKLGTSMGTGPHPAFIRPNGSVMTHFEYGVYLASNDGSNNPVSEAFKDPYVNVSYDTALAKCAAMGAGWHLANNAEWAAIALLCQMNGWNVLGNTNDGRSHSEQYQSGVRADGLQPGDSAGDARTFTGSGPLSWRHNNAINGIADLVGNVWEWQDGFKQVEGQIVVAERNGAAEVDWVAQAAWYNGDSKLANAKTSDASFSVTWIDQQKDANYIANPLLQSLLIEPIPELQTATGILYCSNTMTGFPRRGGYWDHGSDAGLGALVLHSSRTYSFSSIGFRPAFFE